MCDLSEYPNDDVAYAFSIKVSLFAPEWVRFVNVEDFGGLTEIADGFLVEAEVSLSRHWI